MLLKISPDIERKELDDIVSLVSELKIDGIIATNTTISRDNLKSKHKNEIGGLSGESLKVKSNDIIRYLRKELDNNFPIIGVGGIMTKQDAIEKLNSGANLIQLYTGFIYKGPGLIRDINKAIINQSN
jgi:dihydroorotate dehydrogenase